MQPKLLFLGVAFLTLSASFVKAQTLNGFLNQFINGAQQQQQRQVAADAWSRTDPDVVACVQRSYPVNGFVQSGIGPADPKIAGLMARCTQLVASQRFQQEQQQRVQAQAEAQREHEVEQRKQAAIQVEIRRKQEEEQAAALRTNSVLREMMGNDPQDVTVLVVGHDTAAIVRNLRGDLTFQGPVPICEPFGPLSSKLSSSEQMRFLAAASAKITKQGGGPVYRTNCGLSDIENANLVAFSGSQIAEAPLGPLKALVNAITKGQLVKFALFRFADFEADEKAIRDEFAARNDNVISAIYIQAPASSTCIVGGSNADALHYLLKRPDSPFIGLSPIQSILREEPSPDAIFVSLKRRECMAAVAATGILREVATALTRDNVPFDIASGTIDEEHLKQWKALATDAQLARSAGVAETPENPVDASKLAGQSPTGPANGGAAAVVAETLPRCDQLPVARDYYVAACVVRGMELMQHQASLAAARSKAETEKQKLQCAPDSLARVGQSASLSASRILTSGRISGLMDFSEAIRSECAKEAAAVLK